jgi:hypothetical protein
MSGVTYRTCPVCGREFGQPNDPGRKRTYDTDACRQRAYRERGGRASGTRPESARQRQRREEAEAWAREEAAREAERQRSERRQKRADERAQQARRESAPDDRWSWPVAGDDAATAKRRRTCGLLLDRARHASTPPAEAAACRERAEQMRERYGL